ncbi:MAG: CoA transferase, partial [Gammaproteobacteria bacterium]|nr:CoA transferase [Gammaproteobacteria bacterium]
VERMSAAFSGQATEHWLRVLGERRVPAGPINNVGEVFSEDYAYEREFVRHNTHPRASEVPTVANPVRFSSSQVEYRFAPPLHGQHTAEILAGELGLSDGEIDRLASVGAIQVGA